MNEIASPLAEEHVLGCLLFDPSLYEECWLNTDDFTVPDLKRLFLLMRQAFKQHGCPEATVILDMVQEDQSLKDKVFQLIRETTGTTSFPHYQTLVREKTVRRRLITAAREIEQAARESKDGLDSIVNSCQSLVGDISVGQRGSVITGTEAVARLIDQLDELSTGNCGLTTGFPPIDRRYRGMRAGQMLVVAGRPSMGKSTFALQIADHVAIRLQKTAMVFSLEMSAEQLMAKSVSCVSNIPMDAFLDGSAVSDPRFLPAIQKVKTDKLIIDDSAGLTMNALAAKARRQKRKELDLIVVDYIGLIRGDADSRTEDVTRISAALKSLARELRVPVIALSQLNRGVEQREDKRPQMSDLRESGALEQDADIITMIYRDEYYNPSTTDRNIAEIITRKHRMGEVGTDRLYFDGSHSKFRPLLEDSDSAFA